MRLLKIMINAMLRSLWPGDTIDHLPVQLDAEDRAVKHLRKERARVIAEMGDKWVLHETHRRDFRRNQDA